MCRLDVGLVGWDRSAKPKAQGAMGSGNQGNVGTTDIAETGKEMTSSRQRWGVQNGQKARRGPILLDPGGNVLGLENWGPHSRKDGFKTATC